jgi:hypothetical protein
MPAMMPINDAMFFLAKQMFDDAAGDPGRRHFWFISLDEEAIFGFYAEDSIVHGVVALP